MGIDVIAFSLGGILLLVGILGGGFELKELKFPTVGRALRLVATTIGFLFIVLGISLNSAMKRTADNAPDSRASKQASPQASAGSALEPTAQAHPIAPNSGPLTDLVAAHKAGLISAIRLADDAEIEACSTLNPSPLYDLYAGEGLRMALANVQTLKSNGIFESSALEGQDFQSFKISPDGLEAEVRVVETWNTVVYRISTKECVGRIPTYKAPQTIFLKRGENGWIINAEVHDILTPSVIPCE